MKLNAKPTELIEDILIEKPKYGNKYSIKVSPNYPLHNNYDHVVSRIDQFCNSNYELKNEPDLYLSSFYNTNIDSDSKSGVIDQIRDRWMETMNDSANPISWEAFINHTIVFKSDGMWVIKI